VPRSNAHTIPLTDPSEVTTGPPSRLPNPSGVVLMAVVEKTPLEIEYWSIQPL
jgi:hypothetical protein